jgi:hypothetical protein
LGKFNLTLTLQIIKKLGRSGLITIPPRKPIAAGRTSRRSSADRGIGRLSIKRVRIPHFTPEMPAKLPSQTLGTALID